MGSGPGANFEKTGVVFGRVLRFSLIANYTIATSQWFWLFFLGWKKRGVVFGGAYIVYENHAPLCGPAEKGEKQQASSLFFSKTTPLPGSLCAHPFFSIQK